MSKKHDTVVTPVGTLSFPKFDKPDAFGEEAPKYKTKFVLDAADGKAFKVKWAAEAKKNDCKSLPFNTDEETGEVTFNASSKFKPKVFDSKNRKLPEGVSVWGGTKARLMVVPNFYKGRLSFRLDQAQIIDLKRGAGAGSDASRFDEAEGFEYTGEDHDTGDFIEESTEGTAPDLDDEVPF